MSKLWYTPPTDKQFKELRDVVVQVFLMRELDDNSHGYVSEKIKTIKGLTNSGSDFMYLAQMLHPNTRKLITNALSDETRTAIRERMLDGGCNPEFIFY